MSFRGKNNDSQALENGTHTISELEFIYNVHDGTIYKWVYRYEKYGIEGLKECVSKMFVGEILRIPR